MRVDNHVNGKSGRAIALIYQQNKVDLAHQVYQRKDTILSDVTQYKSNNTNESFNFPLQLKLLKQAKVSKKKQSIPSGNHSVNYLLFSQRKNNT